MLYSIVLYCVTKCCIVLYCILLYRVSYYIVLYCIWPEQRTKTKTDKSNPAKSSEDLQLTNVSFTKQQTHRLNVVFQGVVEVLAVNNNLICSLRVYLKVVGHLFRRLDTNKNQKQNQLCFVTFCQS